jgi:hypothetical protein
VIVGVDFDNTIVCYDEVFWRAALGRGWIPPTVPPAKTAVRDYLRAAGQESRWTELQGHVYGDGMPEAAPFPGALEFFARCARRQIPVFIISHRTRYPFLGGARDLHQAARDWLRAAGFHDPRRIGLPEENVCFELTVEEKLARIRRKGCSHFIDDLPEFLDEPRFPETVQKILFDPSRRWPDRPGAHRVESWPMVARLLLADEP